MAIAEFKTALRLKPDVAGAHNNLGFVYESKGQFDMAIAEYQTALRLKPYNAMTHYNLAVVYLKKGDADMAGKEVKLALNIRPDFPEARQLLDKITSRRR
jgi:tetratricopeptide (TPR) repeat protein